ncbi:MAG: hypothetical protein AAB215_05925 [Planctomycetota bacterium]
MEEPRATSEPSAPSGLQTPSPRPRVQVGFVLSAAGLVAWTAMTLLFGVYVLRPRVPARPPANAPLRSLISALEPYVFRWPGNPAYGAPGAPVRALETPSKKPAAPTREVLRDIHDGQDIGGNWLAPFMTVVRTLTNDEISALVDPDLNWTAFRDRSGEARGCYARIDGQISHIQPQDERWPYHPEGTWACWIYGRTKRDDLPHLFRVIVLEPPPERQVPVRFEGIYVLNLFYGSQSPEFDPLLVGRRILPAPATPQGP